jgi:hypothetical protein
LVIKKADQKAAYYFNCHRRHRCRSKQGACHNRKGDHRMTEDQNDQIEFKVDRNNLFKEESFTDLKSGGIRRLIPVKPDGTPDKTRKIFFIGQTSLMTERGPIPLQSKIQAKDLQQAIKRFPESMETAMDQMIEQAKKMQKMEQAKVKEPESRIIVPGR